MRPLFRVARRPEAHGRINFHTQKTPIARIAFCTICSEEVSLDDRRTSRKGSNGAKPCTGFGSRSERSAMTSI